MRLTFGVRLKWFTKRRKQIYWKAKSIHWFWNLKLQVCLMSISHPIILLMKYYWWSAENKKLSSYRMNRPGICLLINNVKDSTGEENLLTKLFSSLAFHVEVKRDLSMVKIIEVAQEFAKKDHSSYDSFVCIVLSQCGPGELIVGVDGRKVTLEQVMSEFRPQRSASLKNKPKLFFLLRFVNLKTQSAERRNGGTEFCTDATIALPHSCNTPVREVCPEEADFLLACATSPIVKGKKIKQPQHSFTEVRLSVLTVGLFHRIVHLKRHWLAIC